MEFKKTDEQELLLESVREFITKNYPDDYFKQCDKEHRYPIEFMKGMAEAGLGLMGIPEEWGGTPLDYLTLVMFCEEVAYCTGVSYLTSYLIYIDDILQFGSNEQKKITMDLARQGLPTLSLGISEPQSGSDNAGMVATATRKNGKVYINGHKTFITGAHYSPYMLTMTRDLDNPKPHSAISMWFLDMNKPGVKCEVLDKVGWNLRPASEVYLDNVELEESDLVGAEGKGFIQLMKNFEIERLIIIAGLLGTAQAAFEDAVKYANQREQFGKPIGEFQITQERITDMALKLENMRNFIYKTAWEKENGISVQVTSALCKRYVARAAMEVIDDAMQILGAIGYTNDHRVSRMWRDCRVGRIGGGTDEIMVHIAGRQILKQYK